MTIDARTQALTNPYVPNTTTNVTASTFPTNSGTTTTNPSTTGMDALPGSASTGTSTATPAQTGTTNTVNLTDDNTTVQAEINNALVQIMNNDNNYVPNILSGLRNPTYHFRLFMTTEHELILNTQQTSSTTSANASAEADALQSLYDTLDNLPQATIAESGVTAGFCIQEVEIEHNAGPGYSSRNALLTGMTITITEPLGTSLVESMMTASMALGVSNFNKMWYYLDLTFLAYNDDGSINTSPLDSMNLSNGGRWVYQININSIAVHMSESGCTYTLTCTFTGLAGFEDNTNGHTPDNITCSGTTIQEYLNNFATSLNQKWKDRYLGPVVTFAFQIMPIQNDSRTPATFKLKKTELDPNRNIGLVANGNTFTSQIPAKTSVLDVVTFLYSYCEDAQKMITDTNSAQDLEDTSSQASTTGTDSTVPTATYNGKQYRVPIVPVIESDVKITGYDPITGQYMKQITYTIWSYRSYTSNLSVSQYQNIKVNPAVTGIIAQELISKGYLKKRYDYQFTGSNTEVLKCDLDYNYSFAAILPKLSGWRQDFLSTSTQAKYNPALTNNGSLTNKQNETQAGPTTTGSTTSSIQNQQAQPQQLTSDQLASKLADDNTQITQLQDLLNPSNPTTPDPRTGQPMTAQARQGYQTLLQAYITARDGLQSQVTDARSQFAQASTNTRNAIEAAQAGNNIYAEDTLTNPVALQMTYIQAHSGIDDGQGSTGQWHRGASLVGAVFNQLYAPTAQAMLNVELEIRGDPFWIGYSYLERRATMSGNLPVDSTSVLPNFAEGDTTFVLRFRFPAGIDGTTGAPIIRSSDAFDGMYRVKKVKNVFAGGEFKQTLTAQKLELLSTAIGGPNTSSGSGSTTTNNTNNPGSTNTQLSQ